MFLAIYVYGNITTLGDTYTYIYGLKLDYDNFWYFSTSMMSLLGLLSTSIFGEPLTHFPFLLLSFYGIYYSVSRLKLSNKDLFIVLVLLSFPSFGIWTSIVSKESIGVFYMGVILGYFIDLMENKNRKIKLIEYFALYLLFVFKVQYLSAILSIWVYIKLSNFFNLKGNGKLALLLIHIIIAIFFLYYFRDLINEISFKLPNHFSLDGGSTRENNIWVNDYDVFINAPYGMFIGFWGPTFSEILEKPIQSFAFIESFIIFSFFSYFLFKAFILVVNIKRINIFYFSILLMAVVWLLFVHYPFGVLNPGSAIRYRENFYGFLVVLLFYIYQKIKLRYQVEKSSFSY
ncbi:hypothetical protein [Arcobacter sp. CECT 8983]|uniref:hypothetical protein n=1 Tax=Arcobacter sp. CECT 8983 TaxID=2044508 RepID=UPI00100B1B3D|nr:hypothetical protein [Arcobacter sp. CECT 8983]